MKKIIALSILSFVFSFVACAQVDMSADTNFKKVSRTDKIVKSEEEWKKILTKEQYYVLREQGTEYAFTGEYWNNKEKGIYKCSACELPLFASDTKFKSGTGWPSFWQPIAEDAVGVEVDKSHGWVHTEVHCARCEGHLGHIFSDGPEPTGLRYCINSVSLKFEKKK